MTTVVAQYLPGASPLHRLDPRVKIVLSVALAIALFTRHSYLALGIYAAVLAIALALSGLSAAVVWRSLRPALALILITLLVQLLFASGTPLAAWGPFHITAHGIELAVFLCIRLMLLVLIGLLLTATTAPVPLTDGLAWLLRPLSYVRVPTEEIALMVTIALRFIPTLIAELQAITMAQRARGARFGSGSPLRRARSLIPVLVPLFVISFKRADELATAMEARCYEPGVRRTRLHPLHAGRLDMAAAFIVAAAILAASLL
jgi:energy-coupling factor transport system permease protein